MLQKIGVGFFMFFTSFVHAQTMQSINWSACKGINPHYSESYMFINSKQLLYVHSKISVKQGIHYLKVSTAKNDFDYIFDFKLGQFTKLIDGKVVFEKVAYAKKDFSILGRGYGDILLKLHGVESIVRYPSVSSGFLNLQKNNAHQHLKCIRSVFTQLNAREE